MPGGTARRRGDALRFYVFDDRQLYRPGEEVRVKGWLRRIGSGPAGDIEPLPDSLRVARVDAQRLAGQRVRQRQRRARPDGRLRPRAQAAARP